MIRHIVVLSVASLASGLVAPTTSLAQSTVRSGWDLLSTVSAQLRVGSGSADFAAFTGVPFGTYDFGSGNKDVGPNADTIIHRYSPASIMTTGRFDIRVEALQLYSTYMGGVFATLDTNKANTGWMDVMGNGSSNGTWTNQFNVYFDLRSGGVSGTIVGSGLKQFAGSGAWKDSPPPPPELSILISGVNYYGANDFFLLGQGKHDTGPLDGSTHVVIGAIPEPSSAALGALGFGVFWMARLRLKQSRNARRTASQV